MADGYHVTVAVHFGEPGKEIVKLAKLTGVDLIAMATHGRTGLTHLMLGSVAEHVVRHVNVPVFMFRPENVK
jgi:nucleotide-binding universal stress UspA family protein